MLKPVLSYKLALAATLLAISSIVLYSSTVTASFADTSFQNKTAIEALQSRGIISGYSNGTFGEKNNINRAEFLKIVLSARGETSSSHSGTCSAQFTDVHATDWFYRYVCAAMQQGIVSGYDDGTFRPAATINFAEASKILSKTFRQDVKAMGGEWYEPYARSLEMAKAIPTDINAVDQQLTRGQMAQMLWRLTDKRTDQPSKGYLNVKYPGLSINLSSDKVQTMTTCKDLAIFAQNMQSSPTLYNVMPKDAMIEKGMMRGNTVALPSAAAGIGVDGEVAASDVSFSHTNVQVEGVDEADIVKSDGTYLYIVDGDDGQKVRIVKAHPGSTMKETSVIDLSKDGITPLELYIDGPTLAIVGSAQRSYPVYYNGAVRNSAAVKPMSERMPYWGAQRTQVRIYDVSNKIQPKLKRTVSLDGREISTRRIGTKLYMVLNQPMYGVMPMAAANARISAMLPSEVLPMMTDSARHSTEEPVASCAQVAILPHVPSPQYMIVAVVPLDSTAADVQRSVVLGNAENMYMSENGLYIATPVYKYAWDGSGTDETQTIVYRFQVTDNGVKLISQGAVPGRILNQFSMDEHGQTFRIATTAGEMWSSMKPLSNNLYILNTDMQTVGSIENIAPGEKIYSVRFVGDRAYMVTFKTVDPLFVIDTSDARNPRILGKLKIPGYSDYLHPYDATHLIGFGKEVNESIDKDKVHADSAVYYTAVQGMKIALFDVSDVSNPKEIAKEVIGDRGTDSPLLTNHKALLFDKDRNILAFPVTVTKMSASSSSAGDYLSSETVFQGAYVYNISLSGFSLKGKITHLTPDDLLKSGDEWMPQHDKNIQRILRIGDSLLTVSPAMVQSHVLQTVQKEGEVRLAQ